MSAYDMISSAVSEGTLAACKGVGVPVQFSHRGQEARRLYVQPLEAGLEPEARNGVVTELRTQQFRVPIQRHFRRSESDVEPFTPGDTLVWQGKTYSCRSGTMDPYKAVYILDTVEHKRLSSGVGK